MSHMVIHRSADGQNVYHQVESLEEAARHVESLRNSGQGNDARIFRLQEVPIEVKTYYRVEVAAVADEATAKPAAPAPVGPPATAPAPAPPAPPLASAPPAPVAVKPEPATAGAAANGGRFGLFGKS
jgi:hypothetical protein